MSMFAKQYLSPLFEFLPVSFMILKAHVKKRCKADTLLLSLSAVGLHCKKDWKYKMEKPASKREFKVSLKVDRSQLMDQRGKERHDPDKQLLT